MDDMPKAPRDFALVPMLTFLLVACGAGIWIVTTFSPLLRIN